MKTNKHLTALFFCLFFSALACKIDKVEENPSLLCEEDYALSNLPCHISNLWDIVVEVDPSGRLFNNTSNIAIPSYEFIANDNKIYQIKGDLGLDEIADLSNCCEIYEQMDKMPRKPEFEWKINENALTAMAVFKRSIELDSKGVRINNIEDIIWTWNTGMNTGALIGDRMHIKYSDGKDVKDGEIQNTTTDLTQGFAYCWAVWQWNGNGTEIIASSSMLPFFVGNLPAVTVTSAFQILGYWELGNAYRVSDNSDLTSTYPVQGIDVFYGDCDQELKESNIELQLFPSGDINSIRIFLDDNNRYNFVAPPGLFSDIVDVELICDNEIRIIQGAQSQRVVLTYLKQ